MNRMKKFLKGFCLAGVLLMGLPGCDFRGEGRVRELSAAEEIGGPVRMLLVGDPFAMALSRSRTELEAHLGRKIYLEIVGYNDGRRLTLLNARDAVSQFDLVAFDVVWLGEYHQKRVLADLSGRLSIRRDQFWEWALAAAEMEGALYGLPIQPHGELLWVRRDLLEEAGMAPPETTEELLAFAAQVHDPARQRYGLAWNAQRGQPLGQTMAHFFAAFGVDLLDAQGRPAFHTEAGLEAARFALDLLAFSPPDIHSMAWDQRTARFAAGQVAMTYGWGARAYMVEEEPYSVVGGQVLYLPAPHAPGRDPVTPVGAWALGVPVNAASVERSVEVLEALFDPVVQEMLVQGGYTTPGLRAFAENPEIWVRYPVLEQMAVLGQKGHLGFAMRPRIPEWDALCGILGTTFHNMLLGTYTPEEAMDRAFAEASRLFEDAEGERAE